MRTRDSMTMDKKYLGLLLLTGTVALTACGQRTEEGSSDTQTTYTASGQASTGGTTVTTDPSLGAAVADSLNLRVLSNVNSINTGGTDVANITALVTDANNNAVASQEVTFSSSGGVLQNITPTTDENGEASATLKLPQDFQNQDILVTVSAETYAAAVKVVALGSELEVTGPDTLVSGDQAELVVSLVAGNGEPIANQTVTVESTAGNTVEPEVAVTDPDGRVSLLIGSENSNDTILINALNDTVSATHTFEVAADVLQFADGTRDAELPVSEVNEIAVTWLSQGVPVTAADLRFSTTAGEIVGDATIRSNLAGQAVVRLQSNSAGPAKLTVEAADGGKPKTSVDLEFVATTPGLVEIDATSSRVHALETSTIMGKVTDANGNPVKNQTVNFTSVDLKGGQLNPASANTNSAGVASVTFTAGANATELNDINIESQVKGTTIVDTLSLTVVKRTLNVTLGTSNEVNIKPLGTQYALPFIVQVADGGGAPLENANVKLSVTPIHYTKGQMVLFNEEGFQAGSGVLDWAAFQWGMSNDRLTCASEDTNGNRYLDVGEDNNTNGTLDPQDPASLASVEGDYATIEGGIVTTDKNGSGFFEMLYPASNSLWAYVEITARAEALGAEAESSFRTILPLPGSESNATDELPANHYSPYGQDLDCTNTL